MDEKTKGGNATPEIGGKDKHLSLTAQVLEIFKTGQEITAYGLNRTVGFNDARKAISLIKREGYPIRDRRLPDRRKVYSLPSDWKRITSDAGQGNKQLNLFGND